MAREGLPQAPDAPWAAPAADVARALGVSAADGLADDEAARRLALAGPNRLRRIPPPSIVEILFRQVKSLVVALLAAAAAVSFVFGDFAEGVAILAVLAVNTAIGFWMEWSAARSLESLRKLAETTALVVRGGRLRTVPAESLAPGDVVLVEGGDVVAADVRLVEASRLEVDESALTGESVPVEKSPAPVAAASVVADRTCMLHQGTAVTKGNGTGIVVATGMNTRLGEISSLVEQADRETPPLERRLDRLGRRLIAAAVALVAVVGATSWLSGRPLLFSLQIAIALAVAAVPEGLPIVATITRARGMWRMARRNALVENSSAVETLGATSLILTDKTGTLTENRMTVARVVLPGADYEVEAGFPPEGGRDPELARALRAAVLCVHAALGDEGDRPVGDPMEVALLVAGRKAGLRRRDVLARWPQVGEVAFDPATKRMATVHRGEEEVLAVVKGAPESVLPSCESVASGDRERPLDEAERRRWEERADRLAGEGLRMLALAERRLRHESEDPFRALVLLGLVGLVDPPREGVAEAVAACRRAGIRVIMVTGDHPGTALRVARAVKLADDPATVRGADLGGLARGRMLDADVVARADPRQKMELLAAHQESGSVVAMLGDGVNDAPTLRRADIGVAMGRRGTQVAREAADMVLRDDDFATIVAAVEEGRVIFGNIRKFVLYLLSCNASEVAVVGLATLANLPMPLLPLQILFLNLITDVFPALALGFGEGSGKELQRPPRPKDEDVLAAHHWRRIAVYGGLLTATVLGALWIARGALGLQGAPATTVSFLTLALAQLWHVLNMAEPGMPILRDEVTRNRWVWGALALCAALLLLAVYAPPLARVLEIEPPDARGWALILAASALPTAAARAYAALRR